MALQPPTSDQNQGEDEEQSQFKMAMLMAQQQQQANNQPPPADVAAPVSLPSAPTPTPDALQTQQPDVTLAHANIQDQPASKWVSKAEGDLSKYESTPMWKRMLVPALVGATTTLGAHTRGGAALAQAGNQDIQNYIGNLQGRRTNLQQQVQNARQQQMSEYELDQRNRQQDLMTAANNQTRNLMAQIAANSRQEVAGTNAGAREYSADVGGQSREAVAGTNATSREAVAGTQANSRLEVAKINAQAALNRFLAGQDREDARQSMGFGHADNKPTADEDRRADLSQAMMGYADMLSDIAARRPELFGPLAGRITQGKQWLGTDDPDVANLKFLREQLGITQMGAHSLRSAQAISPIADALVNSFHNDAATVIKTAAMAKKGVGQFLNPIRPTVGGVGPTPPNPHTPLRGRVAAPAGQPQVFTVGNTRYAIPPDKVAEFKRDHPDAR